MIPHVAQETCLSRVNPTRTSLLQSIEVRQLFERQMKSILTYIINLLHFQCYDRMASFGMFCLRFWSGLAWIFSSLHKTLTIGKYVKLWLYPSSRPLGSKLTLIALFCILDTVTLCHTPWFVENVGQIIPLAVTRYSKICKCLQRYPRKYYMDPMFFL